MTTASPARHAAEGQLVAALRHLGDEHAGVVRHRLVGERVAVRVMEIGRQVQRLARLAYQQGQRRKPLRHLGRGYRLHRHRHGLVGLRAAGVAGRHDDNGFACRHAAEGQPVAAPRQVCDDDAGVVRHRRVGEAGRRPGHGNRASGPAARSSRLPAPSAAAAAAPPRARRSSVAARLEACRRPRSPTRRRRNRRSCRRACRRGWWWAAASSWCRCSAAPGAAGCRPPGGAARWAPGRPASGRRGAVAPGCPGLPGPCW